MVLYTDKHDFAYVRIDKLTKASRARLNKYYKSFSFYSYFYDGKHTILNLYFFSISWRFGF